MISVDRNVARLFRAVVGVEPQWKVFCNYFPSSINLVSELADYGALVSAISTDKKDKKIPYHKNIHVQTGKRMSLFQIKEQFHAALTCYPFVPDNGIANELDQLMNFQISRGRDKSEAPLHLLGLESMLRATFPGGYFGAVLPAKWVGRDMRYLRWFTQRAALLAEFTLPGSSVLYRKEVSSVNPKFDPSYCNVPFGVDLRNQIHSSFKSRDVVFDGDWKLLIWSKSLLNSEDDWHDRTTMSFLKQFEFAKLRHPPVKRKLDFITPDSIKEIKSYIQSNEWFNLHIRHFHDFLSNQKYHSVYGTNNETPRQIRDPSNIWFFQPTENNICKITVMDQERINKTPQAIQLRPGTRVKLVAGTRPAARRILHDIQLSGGITFDEKTGDHYFNFDKELSLKHWEDLAETLLRKVISRDGLVAATPEDAHKIKKQARWLNIQLTPNERVVPLHGKYDESSESDIEWEELYTDFGMEATFPEVINDWRHRADKMNLKHYLSEFQYDDVTRAACHEGLIEGSTMGAGKTRKSLFGPMLNSTDHTLLIVPGNLIGEWQDEIDKVIIPFVRRNRRDWQGKIMRSDVQVINWAKDCFNLKRFNIISYDKLKAIPRDGRFHRCPSCGNICYSADSENVLVCPGDSDLLRKDQGDPEACGNLLKSWRKSHVDSGNRKYRVLIDDDRKIHWDCYRSKYYDSDTGEMKEYDPKIHRPVSGMFPTPGNPVYQFRKGKVVEVWHPADTQIIDQRGKKPIIPVMERQGSMFKKMLRIEYGKELNRETGEWETQYKNIPRPYHVKWTFAELLRNRVRWIIADEAVAIKNPDSKRTQAVTHLNGKWRRLLSGTPLKGMPQNILPLLNWAIKRAAYPEYRAHDAQGMNRFMDRYRLTVRVGAMEGPGGVSIGGKDKQLPLVNNAELFQAELAPFMIRRLRMEPAVLESFPLIRQMHYYDRLRMDDKHRAYYQKWLNKFTEWYEKLKEEEEGRAGAKGEIMTKLLYLRAASSNPHFMLKNIKSVQDKDAKQWMEEIGVYKGPATSKMLKVREVLEKSRDAGDKALVFAYYRAMVDYQTKWAKSNGYYSMAIHGGVPLTVPKGADRSKRHLLVDDFRNRQYNVMFAGIMALKEGMNLGCANHVVITDYTWEPSDTKQAVGRVLRPDQTKVVHAHFLTHLGTVEDYMAAWSLLKQMGGDEALDYINVELTTDKIPDIQQYANAIVDGTEETLKRSMWLAVEALRKKEEEEGS